MPVAVQTFHVGLKALLDREGRLLLVREREGGLWELPGGRIDVGEEHLAPSAVLARELREELGPNFACRIGGPVATWIRRPTRPGAPPVFLVGYACDEVRGDIDLSDEHDASRWVDGAQWRSLPLADGYDAALASYWRTRPHT